MKKVQRFGVKRKLAPWYVGPYKIIEQCGPVAYRLQLPPEMSAIFNVFHVSQLKKCLCVPKDAIESTNVKIQSDLTYEEKPIRGIEEMERVTRSWLNSIRWCGTTIVSKMLCGKGTIFCVTPTPLSIGIGRSF